MLLTIHNLPPSCRYSDIKNILNEKCGLSEIALDNLVSEGKGKKVTVGLANDDDGALVVRKINGLILNGNQLYIEDRRRKTGERDQPYLASTSHIQEARSIDPTQSTLGGMQMAANVPMMWNYNMAVPYMVQMPVDQNFAYAGYGGAPQAAHYMEPPTVVPAENERVYPGFQGKSYPPGNGPREQEPGSQSRGSSGGERGPEAYRHQDRKRHHSSERPVPQKRGSRWNEKDAPKPREPSSPRQQWSQNMNRGPRPPLRQPEQYSRDKDQYQPREPKPDYRTPEPQWENRWDAPNPRVEREREWGNGNNRNWEPEPDKMYENQPNQNWRDQPTEGNKNSVPEREGKYSHISARDGPEWFDRQPEKQMDQYGGDQFYQPGAIEHESRPRQRSPDWNDRRPQNDRDVLRRPQYERDAARRPQDDRDSPRRPQNDRHAPRRPQNDRDSPRRLQNDRDALRRPQNERDVPRRPANDRDAPRRPENDRDVPRRPLNDRDAPRRPVNDRDAPRRPANDRDVLRRPMNDRDAPRHPKTDIEVPRRSQNDRDAPRRSRDDRDAPRRPQNDSVRKWSTEPGGPSASRSVSSSNRYSRRDELPRRDHSRSNNVPEGTDYHHQDMRNPPIPPKDLPGGTRENLDYSRLIANDHPESKKPEYRREDFNVPRQDYMPDMKKKPAMREERTHPPSKKKPQTLTTMINRDSYNRGEATATIAKLMLRIQSKTQLTSHLDSFIFKQLKLCIKARIDVLMGEELSSDTDEVIKRYRVKFPVSGDKVLLLQIREKSTKEYEFMQEQRRLNKSDSDEAKQPDATDVAKNNAMAVVATPKKVINKDTVVIPEPKVIPSDGPQLTKTKRNKLTDMKLQRNWESDQDDLYSLDVSEKTSAKLGAAAGRKTASGRNAGAGPTNVGGSGGGCHVTPVHFKSAARPFPQAVKREHAQTGTARGPNAAGAGEVGGDGIPKLTTVPSCGNLPNPAENASANVSAPKPLGKGAQTDTGYILTKRQRRRQNARERARLAIQAGAVAATGASAIEADVCHSKMPLGSSGDSSLLTSAPQRTRAGSHVEAEAAERMAIIPVGYPAERILAEHIPAIQGAVLALVDCKPPPLPKIILGNIAGGALHVSCQGRGASTWFSSVIGREEIAGLRLKLVNAKDLPKPVKMAWKTRIVGVHDLKLMLRVLQRYYPLLQTEHWKIVDTMMGETSTRRIVLMERQSADFIKGEGYQLFSGVDLNSFKLLEDVEERLLARVEAEPRAGVCQRGVASEGDAYCAGAGDVCPETTAGDAEDIRADDAQPTDDAEAEAGANIQPGATMEEQDWTDWPESRMDWESWPISAVGSEGSYMEGAASPMVSEEAHQAEAADSTPKQP